MLQYEVHLVDSASSVIVRCERIEAKSEVSAGRAARQLATELDGGGWLVLRVLPLYEEVAPTQEP